MDRDGRSLRPDEVPTEWTEELPTDRTVETPSEGAGELLLALLAPVDDLALDWIDRLRAPDEAVRVVVAYEPPVGLFPYVPRSDHAETDAAVRALVMLDRVARALPPADPSDVLSWRALTPTRFVEEIGIAGATSTRLVVSWPAGIGHAEVALRLRAWWLARRFTRDTLRPAYRVRYGQAPVPVSAPVMPWGSRPRRLRG